MANEWRCCGCGTVWGSGLSDPACQCATAFTYQREVKGSLRAKVDHLAPLGLAGAPRGRAMGHSRVDGAEKAEGRSAARTGGASDLPELRSQEELDRMAELEFSEYGRGPRAWYLVWVAVGIGIWGALAWLIG